MFNIFKRNKNEIKTTEVEEYKEPVRRIYYAKI